jgi:LysR family cyn operon transcriptional activator
MHFFFHILCNFVIVSGMNLRHLRAFAAVVDSGGVARAAGRLHLSQPALSRQIHALESELGVPLFNRIGRGVQLTSEGEDLLRRGRRLLTEADSLGEHARSLKAGETGLLRFGATPQVIENLLADFLTRYRRRHPGVEVQLVEDGGVRLHSRLEHGDCDLAMTTGTEGTRFRAEPVYPIHLIAALSSERSLGRRAVLEIADLADEPLLLLQSGFASRAWFDVACQTANIRPRVLLESAAPHTVVALAATDYGIAILPSNARVAAGVARAVPLVHRGASVGKWQVMAWDPRRFLAPYAEQFVAEIVAYCRRDFPGRSLIRRAPPLPRPKNSAN